MKKAKLNLIMTDNFKIYSKNNVHVLLSEH